MQIAFLAHLDLPPECHKQFIPAYLRSPKLCLEQWLSGALSNLVTDSLLGEEKVSVEVKWIKENNTTLKI